MAPPTSPAGFFSIVSRDIQSDLSNAGHTLSSWDNCMAEAYCKWPVIVAIILGSLIALSIVFCCARCLCCGLECCCGPCAFCNRCCPSPRSSSSREAKYDPAPRYPYPQYPPYQPAPPMNYPPQFATFETSSKPKKIHEDSLPEMPSWQNAESRVVEDTSPLPPAPNTPGDDAPGRESIAMGAVGTHNQHYDGRSPYEQEREPMLSPTGEHPYPYQNTTGFAGGDLSQPEPQEDRRYANRSPYARSPTSPGAYNSNPYGPPPPAGSYYSSAENSYTNAPPPMRGPPKVFGPQSPSVYTTPAPSYHTRGPTSPTSLHSMPDGFAGYAPRRSESTRYEPSESQRYPADGKTQWSPISGAAELPTQTEEAEEELQGAPSYSGQHHAASELFYPPAPPGVGRKPVGGSWPER